MYWIGANIHLKNAVQLTSVAGSRWVGFFLTQPGWAGLRNPSTQPSLARVHSYLFQTSLKKKKKDKEVEKLKINYGNRKG